MTGRRSGALAGKWRITEMSAFVAEHLDLVEPADIERAGKGGGQIVFGALQAGLECNSVVDAADFDWFGFDEGDDSTLKAIPW